VRMRGRRKWAVATILAAAAVAGAMVLLLRGSDDEPGWTSAPGQAVAASSCADLPEPEFGFERLPPVREPEFDVPSRDPWPAVTLGGVDGRLVGTGQYYGVGLEDSTRQRITRHWRIKVRMLALDGNGEVKEEVSHDKLPARPGERKLMPQMRMRVGDEPGFYKLDIRITGAGRWSGRYGLYLKAVSPHGEGRLVLAGRKFRAGGDVEMRVENLGSERLSYGAPVTLQRRLGDGWEPVPMNYEFLMYGVVTEGGEVGQCFLFELPPKLSPGSYRFVKGVSTHKEPRGYHEHTLTAEFEVVG
jgi:hypothetical protein